MANYSFLSRLLHNLALGSGSLQEACFDIELALNNNKIHVDANAKHVFVSGLARAGTTILMRTLYSSQQFSSLTYRDMPFPFAPNLWNAIAKKDQQHKTASERAHGDGVLVDFDSPEALEEVYWKLFHAQAYMHGAGLGAMPALSTADIEKFRQYIALVLHRYRGTRYLSKNNNNVLRLDTIRAAFPRAVILVPFREPLAHAASLLKQHRQFLAQGEQDRFTTKYMNWLGHHEFGPVQKPFVLGSVDLAGLSPDSLDYWLAQWVNVYGYVLNKVQAIAAPIYFVSYEELCTQQWLGEAIEQVTATGGLAFGELSLSRSSAPGQSAANSALADDATALYARLLRASHMQFGCESQAQ